MNSVLFINGQHEGNFNLDSQQINSLGIVLNAFSNHEDVGCDDKIYSIQITDEWVVMLTENGVEILKAFGDKDVLMFTSINAESSEEKTFNTYREAYEYQFIKEDDVISDKIESLIQSLKEIKNELNK
jgi:hypothetical protein